MNISIQSKGGTPIYEQIATQIKEAILAGKLNKDDALPSIRALSADIKVSVITTKKAYEELEKEKMIYSVPGKGFFVDNPDMAYLEEKRTLSVEEELAAVIEKAKAAELELAFLTLEVRESNAPAIALYAKHGFHPVGKRKNYYDAPKEDAVLMTCYLK